MNKYQNIEPPEIESHFNNITNRIIGFDEWVKKYSEPLKIKSALNKLKQKYEKQNERF